MHCMKTCWFFVYDNLLLHSWECPWWDGKNMETGWAWACSRRNTCAFLQMCICSYECALFSDVVGSSNHKPPPMMPFRIINRNACTFLLGMIKRVCAHLFLANSTIAPCILQRIEQIEGREFPNEVSKESWCHLRGKICFYSHLISCFLHLLNYLTSRFFVIF